MAIVAVVGEDRSTGKKHVLGVDAQGRVHAGEIATTLLTGTVASSGDNTLLSSPGAGSRIVVCALVLQNESAVATTMILKSGATAAWRVYGHNQGDGLAIVLPPGRHWKLADDNALVLNLDGANACGYSIQYYVQS